MHTLVLSPVNAGQTAGLARAEVESIEVLYTRYRQHVYACAFKYCGGRRDAAEDVVANVFIKAAGFTEQFEPLLDKKGWLYRVTKNEAISYIKKEGAWYRRTFSFLQAQPRTTKDLTAEFSQKQTAQLAWETIAEMPARERLVAVMMFIDDRSQAEIAAELKLSEPTISRTVTNIRKTLAAAGWSDHAV